jgi:toxin ParE1/3/4
MPTDFLEFHEEAGSEYDAAFEWYLEPGPDAALRFDAEVNRALAQNCGGPRCWATGSFSTRRFLLRQFPFILIYRERNSEGIQIVAVAHTSRRPRYWKSRL